MGDILSVVFSWAGIAILFLILIVIAAVKVVQEYERGLIFRLGRVQNPKGPGLFLIIPLVDRMVKVDLRVVTLDIPAQEAITRDNVTVKVDAVAYFRVINPRDAIVNVADYQRAVWQFVQTSLRSVLGQSDLDELLIHRDMVNQKLQKIVDQATEAWGIKVSTVEIKDIQLPDTMKRAMAKQAESEREKRAKLIHAEGENNAAQQLREAATTLAQEPAALQLRYLQTLTEIAVEKNSTIIFPIPIEFFRAFAAMAAKAVPGEDVSQG